MEGELTKETVLWAWHRFSHRAQQGPGQEQPAQDIGQKRQSILHAFEGRDHISPNRKPRGRRDVSPVPDGWPYLGPGVS